MNKDGDELMTISPYCCPHDPLFAGLRGIPIGFAAALSRKYQCHANPESNEKHNAPKMALISHHTARSFTPKPSFNAIFE
jgi:hypothetical protein